ncbi:hypothetical protein K1T71_010801 [Dendrolimus kikuchii]|uniref:Uncharacterized protein n=1 Tax=Dendrolimus kikuchii TaxID=765133 RepID=A0ACC1CQY5_9NEOP|nr:hypothetical protein K1T71_010801 [Dendrolimus kikuchii]
MANETNEISDIVKKCKILLLDIEGTTTSISFVKDKLFPYAEENIKEFLDTQWDNEDVKEAITGLRKLAHEDREKSVEGVVTIPGEDASKEDQIKGLVESVKWQMSQDRKVGALKQLQGLIWKQGYDKGDIKGHVYEDVSPALQLWRSVDGQKVYIYSSGSVQAQKLLFGQSLSGDMLPLIDGHFDTAIGAKQEAASYTSIAEKIGCMPEEILFLTDIVKEGEAARSSGMQVALVSREGNATLPPEATSAFPVLHSFAQLANTNKRKPPSQDDQPAKVLKTDTEDTVKTAAENVTSTEVLQKPEEPEKMDVEEPVNDTVDQKESVEATRPETIVEDVTDAKEIAETPTCETESIVEESTEKTEEKMSEMDTETTGVINSTALPEDKSKPEDTKEEDKAPVAEETPPTVITEIEELPDDKQSLSEVAEIIEDLEPIVEEPPAIEEMDDLQNVGEVLEKECDEILSKVQDVTNLDNIPIKPLLSTIAEETMETENTDSNDIVDRILDTEMELAMKPCEDIEVIKPEEMSDTKTQMEHVETAKQEENIPEKVPDGKPTEFITEEPKNIDNKIEKSSPKEENVEDIQVNVKDTIVESLENNMQTEESKEQTVEKPVEKNPKETVVNIENKDSNNVVEQNNIKTEESKTEPIVVKIKETEVTPQVVKNKIEVVENKTEVVEKKTEVVENKTEVVENKTEVVENKTEVVENKMEVVENKIDENKSEVVGNKTEVVENKTEAVENKTEVVENKIEVLENKTEVLEHKTEVLENKTEIIESKTEIVENKTQVAENKTQVAENKTQVGENKTEVVENKTEVVENNTEVVEHKTQVGEDKIEMVKNKTDNEENKTEVPTNKTEVTESKEIKESEMEVDDKVVDMKDETDAPMTESQEERKESAVTEETMETKESISVPVEVKSENEVTTETQVNGNTTNGDSETANLNGDASQAEELSSRLSVENGKEEMNGSNGDSNDVEQGQGDNKMETEVADIKVKSVATDEPRSDPIDQPTEA